MPRFSYVRSAIKPKGRIVYEYNPLYNYRPDSLGGEVADLETIGESLLNFDLEHPVNIICLKSYDGSVNLILNDNKNLPRLINSRFTARENNTYERIDRTGNTDTNLYDESEFEIDTSLLKKYINIPQVDFLGVYYGGNLPVGNYTFYFKLSDGDGNETDIVAESGVVTIHMGSLNDPFSMRGGTLNENSGKSILFILTNVDSGYDYITVYYSRTFGADNLERNTQAVKILNRFRIRQNICNIHITGNEKTVEIPVTELSQNFFLASSAKTLEVCQNMLFLGNVKKYTPDYETLAKLSLGFIPYYTSKSEQEELGSTLDLSYPSGGYYNVKNIYEKVGYWNEEIYRFGIVYIMSNGSLSPVYNIRGINLVPKITNPDYVYRNWDEITVDYDSQIIDNSRLENAAGVCRIEDTNIPSSGDYFQVRHFIFKALTNQDSEKDVLVLLKKLNIKGYFFVRQKRIPTILCLAFLLGRDNFSGIPCWNLKNDNDLAGTWVTESFINSNGYITHNYGNRLVVIDKSKIKVGVGICPEYEMNLPYYNNIFTGASLKIKPVSVILGGLNSDANHIYVKGTYPYTNYNIVKAKVVSVPDSGMVRDGNTLFRNIAGSPNEVSYQYLVNKNNKPNKTNFDKSSSSVTFVNGIPNFTNGSAENYVRIARGLYGPYLGIYDNNLLKENSLVNIYIPGYDSNLMYEYFKIRINCEDKYYPISQRASIDSFDKINGLDIYRGDCFISLFTHRINRNFQDPDAPNNDTIIDEDTWREKYDEETNATDEINRGDLNAVRMGTYITMKCYSSINLAMRDWDGSFPGEEALTGNKRSFYPLSSLRVDGHSKIPESSMFNLGFSSTTGERYNSLLPMVPYIKNSFLTRVIYSDIAQTDAFKNGFRVFRGTSYVDFSNQYGGITKLIEWKGDLIIVFEHAIALAQVNEHVLLLSKNGKDVGAASGKPLETTPTMISSDFGSQWLDSIIKTEDYIYGVDTVGKKIWRTDGKTIKFISDFKVQKFLNDNITLSEKELTPVIGIRNVKTHYNAFKHDIMFTFYDNTYGFEEKVWNLCWNEYQEAFVTFYSWVPSYSANIDNIYFSYDRNASKWIAKLNLSTYGSRLTRTNINSGWNIDLTHPDDDTEYVNTNTSLTIINNNASGICMYNPLIPPYDPQISSANSFTRKLYLANRPVPEGVINTNYYLKFEKLRDNFGFCNYFDVIPSGTAVTISGETVYPTYNLVLSNYLGLLQHWFTINGKIKDPIIPCILLNIKCSIYVRTENSDPSGWELYQLDNAGFYESLVFITLKDIYYNYSRSRNGNGRWQPNISMNSVSVGNLNIELPTFETAFWKHGLSGIIDIKDRIKPCFWYGKQHPFEFEYVTGNDNAAYKSFDNLLISSNNVAPESIHYTIIGDSYDFSDLKPAIYFRQEATKAFYQHNGSDIIYDHTVFDKELGYIPDKITTSSYIERDLDGNPLRHRSAVSTTYKDTLLPWLYVRQDTFNEVEDYYKKITATKTYADYPNLTGGEIQWDLTLDQFSICNHVKCRDIKEVGRVRGNIQYINDKWNILISPLNVFNRNDTWSTISNSSNTQSIELPKLVINNIPQEIFEHHPNGLGVSFPPELNGNTDYLLGNKNFAYTQDLLDFTEWNSIANGRKEVKLLDKVLKTRIRYKGDKLAIILATSTSFNTIA